MIIGTNLQMAKRYTRHHMKNVCNEHVDLRKIKPDGSIDWAAPIGVAPGTEPGWTRGGYPAGEPVGVLLTTYKPGRWHVSWIGLGSVEILQQNGAVATNKPNRIVLDMVESTNFIDLTLRLRGEVSNLVFVHEGYLDTYESDPWLPDYVAELKAMGWGCLRFFEDSRTPMAWAQRRRPGDLLGRSYTLEHRVALCNAVGAHHWFICPGTDTEYWNGADAILGGLNDGLLNYWEVRNEVWNAGGWPIGQNYAMLAQMLNDPKHSDVEGANEYQRVMRLHALLTAEMGEMIANIEDDTNNAIVLSGQHANLGITRDAFGYLNPSERAHIDHFAPAAYTYLDHTAAIDWVKAENDLTQTVQWNQQWKDFAVSADKSILWYEGGNHHNSGLSPADAFVKDSRGADLIRRLLEDAKAKGVELVNAYEFGPPGTNVWAFDRSTEMGAMYESLIPDATTDPLPDPDPEPERPAMPTGLEVVDIDRDFYELTWDVDALLEYSLDVAGIVQVDSVADLPISIRWEGMESKHFVEVVALDTETGLVSDPATLTVTRPAAEEPVPDPEPEPDGPTLQDVLDAINSVIDQGLVVHTRIEGAHRSLQNALTVAQENRNEIRDELLDGIRAEHEKARKHRNLLFDGDHNHRVDIRDELLDAIRERRVIAGVVTAGDGGSDQ